MTGRGLRRLMMLGKSLMMLMMMMMISEAVASSSSDIHVGRQHPRPEVSFLQAVHSVMYV